MVVPKIDVNFINPFVEGAIETFKVTCSFIARPGKPFIRGQGPTIPIDIAAIIALKSAVFNGTISICFPKSVFLTIMGNMLDEKYIEITPDLEDGASELLNIIFGLGKKVLNLKGYAIEKAIPSILLGKDVLKRSSSMAPTIILPFEGDMGPFQIEISTDDGLIP